MHFALCTAFNLWSSYPLVLLLGLSPMPLVHVYLHDQGIPAQVYTTPESVHVTQGRALAANPYCSPPYGENEITAIPQLRDWDGKDQLS